MIKGLYEAHLPVSNLEEAIGFYQKLELELAWKDDDTAFFWMEKEKSWLGLWQSEHYQLKYHPSIRHIAFRVDYLFMKQSVDWLKERGIETVPFGGRETSDPFVRPHQGNASVYFNDPDGNSLEFMCFVDVPPHLSHLVGKYSLEQWETMVEQKE